jgi:hypothetical protein
LLFPCLIFLLSKTQTTYPIPTLSHVHTQHSKQFIHSTYIHTPPPSNPHTPSWII